MDAEFLKTLGLEQEAIDKIMAEAQKDADALERVTGERDDFKAQLDGTAAKLKDFEGVDVEKLTGEIKALKGDLEAKEQAYQQQLADRDFQDDLNAAMREAGAINAKAVAALLDTETLKASKNRKDDLVAAMAALRESDPNQFQTNETPPHYANGTGSDKIPDKAPEEMTYTELCSFMDANPGAKL